MSNEKFDCSIAVVDNVNISGSSDLMVDGLNIVSALSGKHAALTSATAVGAQSILSVSTIKCLKTVGNLSMTSDATSITFTGVSNFPILTTGKL